MMMLEEGDDGDAEKYDADIEDAAAADAESEDAEEGSYLNWDSN